MGTGEESTDSESSALSATFLQAEALAASKLLPCVSAALGIPDDREKIRRSRMVDFDPTPICVASNATRSTPYIHLPPDPEGASPPSIPSLPYVQPQPPRFGLILTPTATLEGNCSHHSHYSYLTSSSMASPSSAEVVPPMAHAVLFPHLPSAHPSHPSNSFPIPPPLSMLPSLTDDQQTKLRAWKFPTGLIHAMHQLREHVRFVSIDNSGSMYAPDGKELRKISSDDGLSPEYYVVRCTRWAELSSTIAWHASCAGVLQSHTIFSLLNATSRGQVYAVADPEDTTMTVEQSVQRFRDILKHIKPQGSSPLVDQIRQIRQSIAAMAPALQARDQKAIVVLCTDGMPTDAVTGGPVDLVPALKALERLPVWVVVRLCSDDPGVVQYFNDLDLQLELSIEVIDDFFTEAEQVTHHNPWLNYALPLHRCREMGLQHRVLAFLNERALTRDEILEFCRLLFGESTMAYCPDIHTDWKDFCKVLQRIVAFEPVQYNPCTRKLALWIDTKQLYNRYSDKRRIGSHRCIFRFRR